MCGRGFDIDRLIETGIKFNRLRALHELDSMRAQENIRWVQCASQTKNRYKHLSLADSYIHTTLLSCRDAPDNPETDGKKENLDREHRMIGSWISSTGLSKQPRSGRPLGAICNLDLKPLAKPT
jgi:hypothetical protein